MELEPIVCVESLGCHSKEDWEARVGQLSDVVGFPVCVSWSMWRQFYLRSGGNTPFSVAQANDLVQLLMARFPDVVADREDMDRSTFEH